MSYYVDKKDPWSSHSLIEKWLRGFQPGTRVLDVGTASGILGRRCAGLNLYLKGIEPMPAWAAEAQPYYNELLCSSLEQAPQEFLAKQDVVVCADVLEHTINPDEILRYLAGLQKPGTQFFISVPNVAHIWVRANLLFGRFNYTQSGILDRTHLRFYTRSTFLEMLRSSGLRLVEMKYSPVSLSRVHPFFENNRLGRWLQRCLVGLAYFWPGMFAYQFVARSEIPHEGVKP
jgi:2-polyprenyl-3-methyl-5-hydroxy-6-metoxy-1,4-benzoquinol methylase